MWLFSFELFKFKWTTSDVTKTCIKVILIWFFCWARFAEISSGDDTGKSSPELSEHEEKAVEVDTDVNVHNSSNILLII